jgi:hypothetical protein
VKFGTMTLPNISEEINILQLLPGDILNLPHTHVVLFDKFVGGTSNSLDVWEATTGGYDRVINRTTSWRQWLGYTARRYRSVC